MGSASGRPASPPPATVRARAALLPCRERAGPCSDACSASGSRGTHRPSRRLGAAARGRSGAAGSRGTRPPCRVLDEAARGQAGSGGETARVAPRAPGGRGSTPGNVPSDGQAYWSNSGLARGSGEGLARARTGFPHDGRQGADRVAPRGTTPDAGRVTPRAPPRRRTGLPHGDRQGDGRSPGHDLGTDRVTPRAPPGGTGRVTPRGSRAPRRHRPPECWTSPTQGDPSPPVPASLAAPRTAWWGRCRVGRTIPGAPGLHLLGLRAFPPDGRPHRHLVVGAHSHALAAGPDGTRPRERHTSQRASRGPSDGGPEDAETRARPADRVTPPKVDRPASGKVRRGREDGRRCGEDLDVSRAGRAESPQNRSRTAHFSSALRATPRSARTGFRRVCERERARPPDRRGAGFRRRRLGLGEPPSLMFRDGGAPHPSRGRQLQSIRLQRAPRAGRGANAE